MKKLLSHTTAVIALATILAGSPALAQTRIVEDGELSAGDDELPEGEYYDRFYFDGRVGDTVDVTLESDDFDAYLMLRGPDDFAIENDDEEGGDTTNSRIVTTLTEDGRHRFVVTSYGAGETGSYRLNGRVGGRSAGNSSDTGPAAGGSGGGVGSLALGAPVSGALAAGDPELDSGEYFDTYTLSAEPGTQVDIRLQSPDFDTYLAAFGAGDLELSNDDDPSVSGTNSRLEVTVPSDGQLRIAATSYAGGETGSYTLSANLTGRAARQGSSAGQSIALGQSTSGTLASSDPRGDTSVEDTYLIEAQAGQSVRVALSSDDFDALLRIEGPGGFSTENDDAALGSTLDSLIETQLPASGTYRVVVASYASDGLGSYTLDTSSSGSASASAGGSGTMLAGGNVSGTLAAGDETIPSGEFYDSYSFEGRRGQRVTIDMASADFDTYLSLLFPGGGQEENDDRAGDEGDTNSRLTVTLPEDGTYQLVATSYQSGETGSYSLATSFGEAVATTVDPRRGSSRVFALSVGVADYGGRAGNLSLTDQDATKLTQSLRASGMLANQSVTLINRQATRANFISAIDDIAANIGPNDLFLLFFSGHGSKQQVERFMERDGTSETIELFDAPVTDFELAQMIDPIQARTLLVLDACFSGGFDDVINRRTGRMGVFSSDSDLTSLVASKFQAGGYISHILQQAVEGRADANADSAITAGELSEYMRTTFYQIALAEPLRASTYGAGGSRAQGYQHIVVNRGGDGMAYEEVLLNLAGARISQARDIGAVEPGVQIAFAD